jgi:glycogen debranching enzyme
MTEPWGSSEQGPPASVRGAVTVVGASGFCISTSNGDIDCGGIDGYIDRDTRFLSEMIVTVDGERVSPLGVEAVTPGRALFVGTCGGAGQGPDATIVVIRRRHLGTDLREQVEIRNHGPARIGAALEVRLAGDFADLFEVKEHRSVERHTSAEVPDAATLVWRYRDDGFERVTHVAIAGAEVVDPNTVRRQLELEPGTRSVVDLRITTSFDGAAQRRPGPAVPSGTTEPSDVAVASFRSSNDAIDRMLLRTANDLTALRIRDPEVPERTVIAAGAPWFMTLFGRDSLITSWMTLPIDPELALDTLDALADRQGRHVDPVSEEEPGRIMHEIRSGQSVDESLGAGGTYYGTADATPLFVMLLAEASRWGATDARIDRLLPAADRCLAWIEDFGDRDGDGYVEYARATPTGLEHQGWKDSWDGTRFADGRIARPPVALAEVQGYVYAALQGRAELADQRADDALATALRRRASDLRDRFDRDFWIADRGWYAMGLDADKQPIDARASNVGHCLWTGIVHPDRLAPVVAALAGPDDFSGWGLRTLGRDMTGYNPVGYHVGSVWPHDTAIAVAGLMRYGADDAAQRLAEGLVDAAAALDGRLPELFAGFDRHDVDFPVPYPTSCEPQAWAAATPLLLLRSLFRFDPDLPNSLVRVGRAAPTWLGDVDISGIRLGPARVGLRTRDGRITLTDLPPELRVVER